jgi:hypothetical protein
VPGGDCVGSAQPIRSLTPVGGDRRGGDHRGGGHGSDDRGVSTTVSEPAALLRVASAPSATMGYRRAKPGGSQYYLVKDRCAMQ